MTNKMRVKNHSCKNTRPKDIELQFEIPTGAHLLFHHVRLQEPLSFPLFVK